MKKMNIFTFSCLLIFIVGCSTSINRDPSSITSSKAWEDLKNLKQRKVELDAMSVHFKKKKNAVQLEQIQDEQKNIDKQIAEIESNMNSFEVSSL
jgi:uncharacterized membrane protein (DUF106 family)